MTQTVLTFVARVKPGQTQPLSALLDQIGQDPEQNSYVPFRVLARLHFASFVLHQSADYGDYLVFENNFDGELDAYLEDLFTHAAAGLHQIYSYCQDFPSSGPVDRRQLLGYLKEHVVRPNAYHIGNTGRGASRILQEGKLRDALETQADTLVQNSARGQAAALAQSLRQFVNSDPQWSWIPGPGPRETFLQKLTAWSKLILTVLLAVILLLIWLLPVLIGILVLRYKESTDSVYTGPPDLGNLQDLVEKEDRTPSVQNHMASITIVKPGWLRRTTLRIVLWAVNLLARARATHGELSGISSIHFAHWSLIDNGRRLLFLSNFDGSWENYLDDFIDKASIGLTGVWSNTVDFPRTRFLVFGGAADGPRFKAMARKSQTVTNAWYSAYWDQTVQGIDNNSSIREILAEPFEPATAAAWLRRL
jgi:hypothetical protein